MFRINNSMRLILKVYLLVACIFSAFRGILFLSQLHHLHSEPASALTIAQAFVMGIRFDLVITGYIMLLPALLLFVNEIAGLRSRFIVAFSRYWIFILFSLAFVVSAADIPYFIQFFERFSVGAFEWVEHFDFVLSMIVHEPKYIAILIPLLLLEIAFFILLKRIFRQKEYPQIKAVWLNTILSLLFLGLMFVGVRGRLQKKSPIRIGTAYFSNNAFLNKMGLNPVFTLMRSYLDTRDKSNDNIQLMDSQMAEQMVRQQLSIHDRQYNSPIARAIAADSSWTRQPNVVLIIMESMSAAKMQRYGNTQQLTPFLDSLAEHSTYFDQQYTAGKHTFNGIFSSLFSFPAVYRQHPMKHIHSYDGIAHSLRQKGYSTTYFTTHDAQFDNVEGFLHANAFQHIVSQADYPSAEVKTTLGVPDDYMFRHAIPILSARAAEPQPFFAAFMTASDHGPYYIPEYFSPHSQHIRQQIVEYADWSLRQFIHKAKTQEWFKNTIFVLVADHGAAMNISYEIPLNYFHAPLIFYAPKLLPKDTIYHHIASQIDIYPTIMGMLQLPYVNNTMGIDLLREKRPYAIINNDDNIGVIDSSYLCVIKNKGKEVALYKYRQKDKHNYANEQPQKAQEMTDYAKAHLQLYQDMIRKKTTYAGVRR